MASSPLTAAYCASSALFFAACAYVQLNDPDPIPWVLGYLLGGVVLNGLVVIYANGDEEDADARTMARWLVSAFAVATAVVVSYMVVELAPRIELGLPPRELAWSVLEFEEGREVAGLALLLGHVVKLEGYLSDSPDSVSKGTKGGEVAGGRKRYLGTAAMLAALAGSVYLWVFYQSEMNARYKTEHCDGAFTGTKQEL